MSPPPLDATMCPSCAPPPLHIPYLLRTYQKSSAVPPTVPPPPIVYLCRSSPTEFLPLHALLPNLASPIPCQPYATPASPRLALENPRVCPPPSSPYLPKVLKYLSQKVLLPVSPLCRTFPPPWDTPLPLLTDYPTSPIPSSLVWCFASSTSNNCPFGPGAAPDT